MLKWASAIMESTWAYRWWQAPFLEKKFAPIRRHNDLGAIRRVLDVGCGPGSNCQVFREQDYLGIDINPDYIAYARQRFGRDFEVADATQYVPDPSRPCDFVLLNSLLHHVDTPLVDAMLAQLSRVIAPGGHLHVIDLVLADAGIPRYLALNDRGDFPRTLEVWHNLFEKHFVPVVWEPFTVGLAGFDLWQLIYFKGSPRLGLGENKACFIPMSSPPP